jgi:hypothetical protein
VAPATGRDVFGPLNGVRTALVAGAVLAAIVAAAVGQWVVTIVLGAAVAIHGLGWLYLYRQRTPDR